MKEMRLCLCSKHMVDIQHALALHGRPACNVACLERALNAENLRAVRRTEAYALRHGIERGG